MASLFDPIDALFGINGQDPGQAYSQAAEAGYAGLNAPSPDDLAAKLQQMVYQGDITPEMATSIQQNPSLMNTIQTNQSGNAAQTQALSQLTNIGQNGGMTPQDTAQLNQIQTQVGAQERGARNAIQQNAQARGTSGSGMELASELSNNQNAATNANAEGLGVAANAQQRSLQAMQAAGQLGGQFEGQQFGEASSKAQAQDAINKFNAQNTQNTTNANVTATNNALYRNQNTQQDLANQNTNISNEQALQNATAHQTAYQDSLSRLAGQTGAYNNLAKGAEYGNQQQNSFNGALLGTAGTVASGYLAGKNKTKNGGSVS